MKIIVAVKSVILGSAGEWNSSGGPRARTPETVDLNPFDRPALQAALRLRDQHGGEVTALAMGPECAAAALFEALAVGADRAVLLCDRALGGSDTLATSRVLAAAIRRLSPFDLVLFGTRSADSDTGQVGPQTASWLGLPLVTNATEIERTGGGILVSRSADGFRESFELGLPAALTVHPRAYPALDVPLAGIAEAHDRGAVERLTLAELDLGPHQVGEAGSGTRVLSLRRVEKERHCEFIPGSAEEQAAELVRRLLQKGLIG